MRKSIKNSDFKTPFKFPRSNVSEKKEQPPRETLPYKSVKHSAIYPEKRVKIDVNSSSLRFFGKNARAEDSNDDELPHKKSNVLQEKNTNDKLLESSDHIRPTFSLSKSLKKLSRPFKVPTFIRQIENGNSQNQDERRHPHLGTWHKSPTVVKPVHDPNAENAIVLYDPDHLQENIKKDRSVAAILGSKNPDDVKKVPVIVGMI
jgi:hypothetical protein